MIRHFIFMMVSLVVLTTSIARADLAEEYQQGGQKVQAGWNQRYDKALSEAGIHPEDVIDRENKGCKSLGLVSGGAVCTYFIATEKQICKLQLVDVSDLLVGSSSYEKHECRHR